MSETQSTRRRLVWLDWVAVILLLGYMVVGRAFAHIGYSPVFLGEVALLLFLIAGPQTLILPWVSSLMNSSSSLSSVAWIIFVSLIFGIIQFARGIMAEHDAMVAAMNLVFHVYPLFFFPGLWVGVRHRELLPKLIRSIAWCHGIYGALYIFVFARLGLGVDPLDPNQPAVFSTPDSSAVMVVGLLCCERNWRRGWIPLALNIGILLALQYRSEWLALFIVVPVWSLMVGRFRVMFKLGAAVATVALIATLSDVRIPSPATRGGEISARVAAGRGVAMFDPYLASRISPEADDHDASTISWRTEWWKQMWEHAHASTDHALIGPGYGFAVWELHPDDLGDVKLRTPHNAVLYALAYTGWFGVALFAALHATLAVLLWLVYRKTGQPFGFCFWLVVMVRSNFDIFFESPYFAIPFYLIIGLSLAPLVKPSSDKHKSLPNITTA